jgi:hypothetical protein
MSTFHAVTPGSRRLMDLGNVSRPDSSTRIIYSRFFKTPGRGLEEKPMGRGDLSGDLVLGWRTYKKRLIITRKEL